MARRWETYRATRPTTTPRQGRAWERAFTTPHRGWRTLPCWLAGSALLRTPARGLNLPYREGMAMPATTLLFSTPDTTRAIAEIRQGLLLAEDLPSPSLVRTAPPHRVPSMVWLYICGIYVSISLLTSSVSKSSLDGGSLSCFLLFKCFSFFMNSKMGN